MGMFNYVGHKMPCPNCGHEITEFQTKDGDLYMVTVDPMSVSEFYGQCGKCLTSVIFRRKPVGTVKDNFDMTIVAH